MAKKICFCIHGHFYQPPREDPWTGEIENQESAAPYHDWNERIYHECYLPNTKAQVFDEKGNLVKTVNNFEKISFNIGPTLFSWLEAKHRDAYDAIIKADHLSRSFHQGHGNAIAQVYNHMIMPLANLRDKVTQVKWGIADFKRRFERVPEGMWLPETACDEETLEVLIEEGIRFTILAPHQAEAVRPIDSEEWEELRPGALDCRMPYRCFLKKNPDKFIDLFFYNGMIARDLAFGDLAFEAKFFADSIERAKSKERGRSQIIHVATDGETFGHHKAFGERALAYLLEVEAPKRGFGIVNYGEYLEEHPPRYEVRLNEGEDGEGTSWSCPHGVKRWKEHCGCRGGGPPEWKQHWRKPLRKSLSWLRDELTRVYEVYARHFFRNVWAARNDYINLILDSSEGARWHFFSKHAKRVLSQEEVNTALRLLEVERYAMLMFTSCGWFFTEISGIETVQILRYAARAIQLTREATHTSFEDEFLYRLSKARSNVGEFKDGRGVYEKLVKPTFFVRR